MAYFLGLMRNAILRRIAYVIAALLISFLTGMFSNANAATYTATIQYATNHTATSYPTVEEAKTAAQIARKNVLIAGNPSTWTWTHTYTKFLTSSVNQDTFAMRHNYMRPDGVGSVADTTLTVSYTATCPVGATVVNGSTPRTATCSDSCTAPQRMVNGVCGEDTCLALTGIAITSLSHNTATRTLCHNGCTVKTGFQICTSSPVKCSSNGNFTGSSCVPPLEPTVPATSEHDCVSKGQTFGYVGDVVTCLKAGTTATPPVSTTSETIKTVANPTTGATNNITTTTISNTSNNTVTTTTTGTDANGNAVDEKVTQDKTGFCESNPNSKLCKGEEEEGDSNFSGSCAGAFSCEGDAIQCAIAKRVHLDNCELDSATDEAKTILENKDAYAKGNQLLDGVYTDDVNDFIAGEGGSTQTFTLDQIDENGDASFGGVGLQDITQTVLGQSFTLPLSDYNEYLEYMGYILLALAYLAAFKIVMGSF